MSLTPSWGFNDTDPEIDRPSSGAGIGSTSAAGDVPDDHAAGGIVDTRRRDCRVRCCSDHGPDERSPARHVSIVAAVPALPDPRSKADGALMFEPRAERAHASRCHCANACAPHRTSAHRPGAEHHGHADARIAHSALWRVGNGLSRRAGASRSDRTNVVRGVSAWRNLESLAARTKGENTHRGEAAARSSECP